MEEKKVKVIFEVDRASVEVVCFLTEGNLTTEIWDAIASSDIVVDERMFEDNKKEFKLLLAGIALNEGIARIKSLAKTKGSKTESNQ